MNTHEELAPEFRDVLIRKMQTASPFWDLLGLELTDVRKGWARVRLAFDRKLVHPLGIAHGGTIFSAADSAVAMALIGMVDRSETFTTVEMKLNYLKPFERGSITAEAVEVHGRVNGAILSHKVVLHATAEVDGDIAAQFLSIEQGASFDGRSRRVRDPGEIVPQTEPIATITLSASLIW